MDAGCFQPFNLEIMDKHLFVVVSEVLRKVLLKQMLLT